MLVFTRKYQFDMAQLDDVMPDHAIGATFLGNGKFEVATDEDLSGLGAEVPISQPLAFRVTAKTLDGLLYWVGRLIMEVGGGQVRVTRQTGYWQPTDETEPSWLIETPLDALSQEHLDALYRWLVAEDQQAAYIEYGGKVFIPDRDEVPTFLASLN